MTDVVHTVLSIYLRILRKLGELILLIAGAGAVSGCIVFPLWYLSTHHLSTYNLLIGVLLSTLVLFLIIYKLYRLQTQGVGIWRYTCRVVAPLLVRIVVFCMFLVFFYGIVRLFAAEYALFGTAAALVFVIALSGVVYWSTTFKK